MAVEFYDTKAQVLAEGQRVERKLLVTVAQWGSSSSKSFEILGTRTEDSSIEFNADIETTTDIRGITYTDVNKTEPQQDFDPYYILGKSPLAQYLTEAALKNDYASYNNKFDVLIITMFMAADAPTVGVGPYYAVKHQNCSIIPTALGGDNYVNMPLEVHLSNNIVEGTVSFTLDDDTKKVTAVTFTAKTA